MNESNRLDNQWRRERPLPSLDGGGDKTARGRVLLIGGSLQTPGALRLTGEAALRVGAGKMRIATVDQVAVPLGVHLPEAGMAALPSDARGEIGADAEAIIAEQASTFDAVALGPGMRRSDHLPALVRALFDAVGPEAMVLLDAGAISALRGLEDAARAVAGRLVLTPHPGELAGLLDIGEDEVLADMTGTAADAARRYGAVVALKSAETVIVTPDGRIVHYENEAVGLGTAGSGDVLAGVVAGLMARGAAPLTATGWGVWLHGEAGQMAANSLGPLGFLARDLLTHLPKLMASQSQR